MSKSKVLGIDLGTTNSCVSIIEGGVPKVIENYEGKRVTPSVIAFSATGQKYVGEAAKRQAHANAQRTLYAVKRIIGKKHSDLSSLIGKLSYSVISGKNGEALVDIDGKHLSPSYISGMLLKQLVDDASAYLGYEIKDVVITVPAHFDDAQRQATKNAGEIVGLNVLRIINEPTAAAMAYGADKIKVGKILVFDLGGGTFDVSILEVEEGLFRVLSTDGDTELGGEDFDNEIMQHVLNDFKNKEGVDLSKDKVALYRIKEACEEAKKELSKAQQAIVSVPFVTEGPKNIYCTITRSMFESKISKYIDKAMNLTTKTVEAAGVTLAEIDKIVCVGGSTRIPLVRETLQKRFGKTISIDINPDEAVALGAAIQGGVLSGDISDVVLLDVTPLSLGIESLGGVFTKIIEKDTSIPSSKSRIFTTASDNQTSANIAIYQGERSLVKDNKKLGSFELVGIKNAPRGEPQIEVTFTIDANGILHASAKDLGTGSEQKVILSPDTGLSKEDIEQMCKDAEAQKKIDEEELKKIELKNSFENGTYSAEKLLKENKEKLGESHTDFESRLSEIKVTEDLEVGVEKIQALLTEIQSKLANQP